MCKSLGSRLAVLFLTGTGATLAHAQPSVQGVSVSRDVLAAADAEGIEPMASALARGSVSAGFVATVDDSRVGVTAPIAESGDSTVPLAEAVDRFFRKHPHYALRQSDGALVFRPDSPTACDAALDQPLPMTSISTSAYEAFWRLARMMNPTGTRAVLPSIVCGGGGCDSSEQRQNVTVALSLNGSTTLQEALSQLVSQVPGLVWVLRDERSNASDERNCRLTFHAGDQHFFTSFVVATAKHEKR